MVKARNQLASLPDGFGHLAVLTDLSVSENHLVSLPGSFGQLANVTALNVFGNELASLPAGLEDLQTEVFGHLLRHGLR